MEEENKVEKKSNKKTIAITLCIIAVILIGAGIYQYKLDQEEKKSMEYMTEKD